MLKSKILKNQSKNRQSPLSKRVQAIERFSSDSVLVAVRIGLCPVRHALLDYLLLLFVRLLDRLEVLLSLLRFSLAADLLLLHLRTLLRLLAFASTLGLFR